MDESRSDSGVRREFFGDKSVGDYPPGDTREWRLDDARVRLRKVSSWRKAITQYLYRPFDDRVLLYLDFMVDWPRRKVMRHLMQPNHGLCVGRAGLVASGTWDLLFCTKSVCDHNLFYRGSSMNFPLYLYGDDAPVDLFQDHGGRRLNFSSGFVKALSQRLGMQLVETEHGDLKKTVGALDVFHYIYAILHSPTYRSRYAAFLRVDFPVVPLTSDKKLFATLVKHGQQLADVHTMASPKLMSLTTTFPAMGSNKVDKVNYVQDKGRVYINDKQFFGSVPDSVWSVTIGGFQICYQWLKDRIETMLSYEDIQRYQKIILALQETIRMSKEIDNVIPSWPLT